MAAKKNPSKRQQDILSFIWRFKDEFGWSPSFREIGEEVGLNTTSAVEYQVQELKKSGFVNYEKSIARSLTLTDRALAWLGKLDGTIRNAISSVQLPISGDIVAGEPVSMGNDSFSNYDEDDVTIINAGRLPANTDRLYALRVRGLSMIDALIDDGDVVVLQMINENAEVRNGDMVAAWLPLREEMTLKYFYYEGEMTKLQPANRDFEPIVVPRSEVKVQGKVVWVERQVVPRRFENGQRRPVA